MSAVISRNNQYNIISICSSSYTEEVKYCHMWGCPPICSQLLVIFNALTMHKPLNHKVL